MIHSKIALIGVTLALATTQVAFAASKSSGGPSFSETENYIADKLSSCVENIGWIPRTEVDGNYIRYIERMPDGRDDVTVLPLTSVVNATAVPDGNLGYGLTVKFRGNAVQDNTAESGLIRTDGFGCDSQDSELIRRLANAFNHLAQITNGADPFK